MSKHSLSVYNSNMNQCTLDEHAESSDYLAELES